MAENRKYAGPHEAAELQVADGEFVCVLRDAGDHPITDDQAAELGYSTDVDEAVEKGLTYARRVVAVSDELAAKLDAGHPDGNPSWPKVGGKVGDQVDVPERIPATKPVDVDGEKIPSVEVDRRAYEAAAALEETERQQVSDAGDRQVEKRRQLEARAEGLATRVTEIDEALDGGDVDDDGRERLTDERKRLVDELQAVDAQIKELG